jgi:hypothetical protein
MKSLRARLAFVLLSKVYREMYANTGIATDSARVNRAARWARWLSKPCRRAFQGASMPELQVPLGATQQAGETYGADPRAPATLAHARGERRPSGLVNLKADP